MPKIASKKYAAAPLTQMPTARAIRLAFLTAATKFTRSFSSSPNSAASSPETKFLAFSLEISAGFA